MKNKHHTIVVSSYRRSSSNPARAKKSGHKRALLLFLSVFAATGIAVFAMGNNSWYENIGNGDAPIYTYIEENDYNNNDTDYSLGCSYIPYEHGYLPEENSHMLYDYIPAQEAGYVEGCEYINDLPQEGQYSDAPYIVAYSQYWDGIIPMQIPIGSNFDVHNTIVTTRTELLTALDLAPLNAAADEFWVIRIGNGTGAGWNGFDLGGNVNVDRVGANIILTTSGTDYNSGINEPNPNFGLGTAAFILRQGTNNSRHFTISNGARLHLVNIILEAGAAVPTGTTATGNRGGVTVSGTAQLHMYRNSIIRNSRATNGAANIGGGVRLDGSAQLHMHPGSTITGNTTSNSGGGVAINSTAQLHMHTGSVIASNTATANGGGVAATGTVNILMSDGIIRSNTAVNGAGIHLAADASATISGNARIYGNTASENGGGIFAASGTGSLTISGGIIGGLPATGAPVGFPTATLWTAANPYANRTLTGAGIIRSGAGISVSNRNFLMSGGYIIGNRAEGLTSTTANPQGGAGIAVREASTAGRTRVMTGGTIAYNQTHQATNNGGGGGIYIFNGATFTMTGGIIRNNFARWHGGGVQLQDGTTRNYFNMSGGRIENNRAALAGGGIHINVNNSVNLSGNALIHGNIADTGTGGGIRFYRSVAIAEGPRSVLTMRDMATVSGNTSGGNGGGIGIGGGTATTNLLNFTMYGGRIINNTSNANGGGIQFDDASGTVGGVPTGQVRIYGGLIAGNVANNGGGANINLPNFPTTGPSARVYIAPEAAFAGYVISGQAEYVFCDTAGGYIWSIGSYVFCYYEEDYVWQEGESVWRTNRARNGILVDEQLEHLNRTVVRPGTVSLEWVGVNPSPLTIAKRSHVFTNYDVNIRNGTPVFNVTYEAAGSAGPDSDMTAWVNSITRPAGIPAGAAVTAGGPVEINSDTLVLTNSVVEFEVEDHPWNSEIISWHVNNTNQNTTAESLTRTITANTDAVVTINYRYFTVTFDSNGGAPTTPQTREIYLGDTYAEAMADITQPTRTNWVFEGWYTQRTGGTRVLPTDEMLREEDHTLYARWSERRVDFPFIKTNNADVRLQGAEFRLYRWLWVASENAYDWVHQSDFSPRTSDADGHVIFSITYNGSYRLVESQAPTGFDAPTGYWLLNRVPAATGGFTITRSHPLDDPNFYLLPVEVPVLCDCPDPEECDCEPIVETISMWHVANIRRLTFTKTDQDGGQLPAGTFATFRLYRWEEDDGEYDWVFVEQQNSGAGGFVRFEYLIPDNGEYRLVESVAPIGFVRPDSHWLVTMVNRVMTITHHGNNPPFTTDANGNRFVANFPHIRFAFHKTDQRLYDELAAGANWNTINSFLLSGAHFTMARWNNPDASPPANQIIGPADIGTGLNQWTPIWSGVSGSVIASPMAFYLDLRHTYFQMIETAAPSGFATPFGQWRFTLRDEPAASAQTYYTEIAEDVWLRIRPVGGPAPSFERNNNPSHAQYGVWYVGNHPDFELPLAGGAGSNSDMFYVSGVLVILLALGLMVVLRAKRVRQA